MCSDDRSRASSSTVQIQCICGGSARGEFQCHGVRSCNKNIFTRVRGRRCNSSSNAAGFCMLFCYFGYLSGMLEYHAIGRILCSAFTLCQHEFPPLETKKKWINKHRYTVHCIPFFLFSVFILCAVKQIQPKIPIPMYCLSIYALILTKSFPPLI